MQRLLPEHLIGLTRFEEWHCPVPLLIMRGREASAVVFGIPQAWVIDDIFSQITVFFASGTLRLSGDQKPHESLTLTVWSSTQVPDYASNLSSVGNSLTGD